MKRTNILFLLLLCANIIFAQQVATIGVTAKYTHQLQELIEKNYTIQPLSYNKINTQTLQSNDVLAIFNLHQTWNNKLAFEAQQANDILEFVKNGGALYLTARKAYDNILSPLGITIGGKDGGKTGRQWGIYNTQVSLLEEHPINKDLSYIDIDANALFDADKNWEIIGKTKGNIPLIAVRKYGKGKIVLGAGTRIHRDAKPTTNAYESDITQGDNYQYFVNVFDFLGQQEPLATNTLVEDLKDKSIGKIYPNPATSRVTVVGRNIQQIQVFDSNGKMLQQWAVKSQHKTEVDLGRFAKGLYFLHIKTKTNSYTQEVVLIDN